MAKPFKSPPVCNPTRDVGEILAELVRDTGIVQESFGGFRLKVYHAGAFPWDTVFKELLYREFQVRVTHEKADLFIEAKP